MESTKSKLRASVFQAEGENEKEVSSEKEILLSIKTSFVDTDFLPTFGEKPHWWQPSGKRVKRGQYKTAQGFLMNSDCNGAANSIRKVATQLGISLAKVGRAALNLPKR